MKNRFSLPIMPLCGAALAVTVVLVCGSKASAQTSTYAFDSGSSDFHSKFNFTTSLSSFSNDGWSYQTGTGIGGTNSTQGPGAVDCAAVWNSTGYGNAAGTTVTTSAYFLAGALNNGQGANSGDFGGVGLVSTANGSFGRYDNVPNGSLLTYLVRNNDASGASNGLNFDTFANSGTSLVGVVGSNATGGLTVGDWYRIQSTYQILGSTIQVSATLADYGSTGTASPTTILSMSGTVNNPFVDMPLYAAMYGGSLGGNVSGAQSVDNFAVSGTSAPDAATLPLLLSGAVLAGAVRVRRARGQKTDRTFLP